MIIKYTTFLINLEWLLKWLLSKTTLKLLNFLNKSINMKSNSNNFNYSNNKTLLQTINKKSIKFKKKFRNYTNNYANRKWKVNKKSLSITLLIQLLLKEPILSKGLIKFIINGAYVVELYLKIICSKELKLMFRLVMINLDKSSGKMFISLGKPDGSELLFNLSYF